MKSSLMIKIAAVITLLYAAGHTRGYPWTPTLGPSQVALIENMKSDRFDALGYSRTYWEFYVGFGIISGALMAVLGVVLWQLAVLQKRYSIPVRGVLITFIVGFVANTYLCYTYFFAIPWVMSLVITLCLVVALFLPKDNAPARTA